MEKEFISYEHALELKELGFNETCLAYYDRNGIFHLKHKSKGVAHDECVAPLIQQAFNFFFKNYEYFNSIRVYQKKNFFASSFKIIDNEYKSPTYYTSVDIAYEDAKNACLRKMIEMAKNKIENESPEDDKIRDAAIMLRWVLSRYSTKTIDGTFGWVDSMDKEVSSADIAIEYFKQQ